MVSTRNAPSSTSLSSPKITRGAKKAATQPDTSVSAITAQTTSSKTNGEIPGPKGRKRPLATTEPETPLSAAISIAEQSPNAKRARNQTLSTASSRRTRSDVQIAGQDASSLAIPAQSTTSGSAQPNPGTSIPNMVNYSQTFNDQFASQEYGQSNMNNSSGLLLQGLQLKTQSLPVLENFASQILGVTASHTFEDLFGMAANPGTTLGQAWHQLMNLFNQTKEVYGEDPFLSPQGLGLVEDAHVNTVKKANVATFVCSLFGGRDVGFNRLNESYLTIFAADGVKMLKTHAQLFLDLKTQAYISAVTSDKAAVVSGGRSREGILDDLFPANLDKVLLQRRRGATQLTSAEREFVDRAQDRRKVLLEESKTSGAIDKLPDRYVWENFLRDVRDYIHGHVNEITGATAVKNPRPGRPGRKPQTPHSMHTPQNYRSQQSQKNVGTPAVQDLSGSSVSNDIAEKAARAAHFAMENYSAITERKQPPQTPQNADASTQQQRPRSSTKPAPGPPIQFHFEKPLHPNVPSPPPPFFAQIPYQNSQMQGQWHPGPDATSQFQQTYDNQAMIPYPTQSAPTHVLYERARMAASSKPSQQQTPRKTPSNTPTQRRPWTSDEENALMAGLDRVKGPHWSQIHAMFGPGGTINEALKDRTQVQLKDKARNLKLFFLKSNIEVPYYLQFVTGELKTRAPSRVAKQEAREKGMSAEDRAHVQGVMTLAGTAMQDGEQSGLGMLEATGEQQQATGDQAIAQAGNVNIDPSLEASLQLQNAANAAFTQRYSVPTPEMIMQNLDKYSTPQTSAQQLQ